MPFWRSETLRLKLPSLVRPFDASRIAQGSYELSLGSEAFVSGEDYKRVLETQGAQLVIRPGQFALLITEEEVSIPRNAIGFISLKSKAKFPGVVNVSGFHVDPGFDGRLVFSVYNAGPAAYVANRGEPLFLLWFADLDGPTKDVYAGAHQRQQTITSSYVREVLGTPTSPAELGRRLDRLEEAYNTWKTLLVGLLVGLALLFLSLLLPDQPSQTTESKTSSLQVSTPVDGPHSPKVRHAPPDEESSAAEP